jgi:hypothetical protein
MAIPDRLCLCARVSFGKKNTLQTTRGRGDARARAGIAREGSTMRTKLFLSYSKGDTRWRQWFLRHLNTMVSVEDGLWVDRQSIEDGSDWMAQIGSALADARCALVLLSPRYLKVGGFTNDHELPMLLEEQARGLKLLPVLVAPCSWEDQHPDLCKTQFVKWRNGTKLVFDGTRQREIVRALSEAGDDAPTPAARKSAIDRAVIEVCQHVRKAFGVVGQITGQQRQDLFEETNSALEAERVTLEREPIHWGDFAVVYRGTFENEPVVVKAIPTAAWRNRVGTALDTARSTTAQLRDASFIRIKGFIRRPEVHALVMEYIDWPTLDEVAARHPGRRLPAPTVAKILSTIAAAQDDAHERGVQIGALSSASIHVNPDWEVRLSPIRIEGYLGRGLTLSTGQLVNWDVLTMLTPEIYAGYQPITRSDLDAHDQYYLALLGLELLNGRRPVEVSCFQDLNLKAAFFDDPRAFFGEGADCANPWTEECPALAYTLARMLSRVPGGRLPSSEAVKDDLRSVSEEKLPDCLRRSLEADVGDVVCESFALRFYDRLFRSRRLLELKFSNPSGQPRMLFEAIRDLVEFRRDDGVSRFLDHVKSHKNLGIVAADIEAFRCAFVEEVIATSQRTGKPSARSRGDAWNAVLKHGLGVMVKGLGEPAGLA